MKKTVRILAIGNSFSVDGMEYLWQILRSGGVERVILGNLAIGGCPISLHADHIASGAPAYLYGKNTDGTWVWESEQTFSRGLLDEDWDVITLQQASHDSGLPDTYAPMDAVLDYVSVHRPHARIYWHMTWAYQGNSDHWAFPRYGCDQAAMYLAIVRAVKTEVLTRDRVAGILPVGTVIQNLRTSPLGDTLTRDGFHLSLDHGRYAAALTWAQVLCGVSPEDVDWIPHGCEHIQRDLPYIRRAVADGAAYPYEKTPHS